MQDIADRVGSSKGNVNEILLNSLWLREIYVCWVPHILTENKKVCQKQNKMLEKMRESKQLYFAIG